VALMGAAGIALAPQTAQLPYPAAWLVAGPYQIAISCLVLFAVDFLAERQGCNLPRRFFLTVVSTVALWSVAVRWGHPEDAVAVGLLLYGIGALDSSRVRAGWLIGAARAGRLPAAGGHPERRRGGRRRDRELAGHENRGDQPAELSVDRPSHAVDVAGPAPGRRERRGRPRPDARDRLRLRLRGRLRVPAASGWRGSSRAAVVGGRRARRALRVRVGDGGLLRLAGRRGRARRRRVQLDAADLDRDHRGGRDIRCPVAVAQPVGLVGRDDRGLGPRAVLRPPAGGSCLRRGDRDQAAVGQVRPGLGRRAERQLDAA